MAFNIPSGIILPSRGRTRLTGTFGKVDENAVTGTFGNFSQTKSLLFTTANNGFVSGVQLSGILTDANIRQFSVSVWCKWADASPANFDSIVGGSQNYNNLNDGFGLYWVNASNARFFVNAFNINFVTVGSLSPEVWNHFVGVFDADNGTDNVKLYVNGVSGGVDSLTNDMITKVQQTVWLGRLAEINQNANSLADGNLDELAIWDSALSASSVSDIYNSGTPTNLLADANAANLQLWWRCGDGDSGSTVTDNSSNSHDGTLDNLPAGSPPTFDTDVP